MKKTSTSLFAKYMVVFIAVLLLTNVIAVSLVFLLFSNLPIVIDGLSENTHLNFAVRTAVMSILVGILFTYIATKIVIKPINNLSKFAKKVAKGNLDVQIISDKHGYDEMTELNDNFNLMVRELSKNEYLHKDFVSNVSHEFKTPIAAIQGYSEMLSAPNLSETKRLEYAQIITKQSARLSKLSSDLLRLAELENEEVRLKQDIFRLDEQIRDAILLLQSEWEQNNLDIEVNLEKIRFQGDKALLCHVWINIIGNAIRYTNRGGKITVYLAQVDDEIVAKINDTGIGMNKEQLGRIFERFYRANESRTTGGTGLGLTIAKRIVLLHGGEIAVESEENKGTEFTIKLKNKSDTI